MADVPAPSRRITSLDQFRGYTVAGMFLVNFTSSFTASPLLFRHHNTFCSYADTIMPQFFFAVGFAMRLTFERRIEREGKVRAYARVARRVLGLAVIAAVVYLAPQATQLWAMAADLGRPAAIASAVKDWFQTLMHIAVTSLWILPVLRSSGGVRTAYAAASALLFLGLSQGFYFNWVQHGGIDGGVLGFLAWTIPTIAGTIACDWIARPAGQPQLVRLFMASAVLMAAGWLLSCGTTLYNVPAGVDPLPSQKWAADPVIPTAQRWRMHTLSWAEPPFISPPPPSAREENFWMMSQRAATLSYHVFAAGFSLAVYSLFHLACDVAGWQLGVFRTLGVNALVGYVLHDFVGEAMEPYLDKDVSRWLLALYFLVYFIIVYLLLRVLEWRRIFLRI